MESDQAFEAEAELAALARNRSSSIDSKRKGHDAMQAAVGGFESHSGATVDGTPLLPDSPGLKPSDSDEPMYTEDSEQSPPEWSGAHDFDGLPWWKTPSIFWLLPAFLIFTMAFGGTLVPKLNLILSLICKEYQQEQMAIDPDYHMLPVVAGSDNPQCQTPEVQALVSKFTLYGSLVTGILSAIVSPKLGALSDRYGRKRLIALTTLGLLVNEVITIAVARNPDSIPVYWMLVGYAFDGLGGSFIAAMAISYAYASDCTAPTKRNVAFGYYHGCLFAGIALGPVIAGGIVKATGNILSIFYLAVGGHAFFLLWLIFVVPESLTQTRQRAARKKLSEQQADFVPGNGENFSQNPFSHVRKYIRLNNLLAPLSILWPTEPGTNPQLRRNLFFLAAVDTTMFGVAMGSMTVVLLYAEYVFDWGTYETSIFLSSVNIGRVTVLLVLLPLITRLLRGPSSKAVTKSSGCDNIELGIIRVAVVFDMMGYIGYCTVRSGPLFILCGIIASVGGMGSPTLSSALTKHVPPERTGQVLGAMGLLHAMGRVIAPIIFNLIYAKTVGGFTQTVFVCLASAFGLAFLFSLFIRPHVYWDQPQKHTSSDDPPQEVEVNDEGENEDERLVR